MKFEELPLEMQKGLLSRTRKNLVIGSVVFSAILFGIAALIASIGHNMWVIAVFPALVAIVGIVNLFMELKAPSNSLDKVIRSADYSSAPFESESN
ncbi:MAG: hypothetical protein J6X11_09840 [Treponema sp.]|nr:hypothetical protein [Treponema sp.]MBP5696927.1 hypothetical protein [Treponema sp.]